jgi:dipeptidyl aminopeptidase/acylaminoacyl peptidase
MRTSPLCAALLLALAPLSALATAGAVPPAAEVELIPRDALFGNPERALVQISPDGKYLSWIAPLDGVMNVWVAPADKLDQARAVTRDTARGIRQYFWSYREGTLLYLRDNGGDENFHLYAVDVGSGESRDLSPYENTRALVVGVSHRQPGVVLVGMNDRDPKWHDLYRVDLASGERSLLLKNEHELAEVHADSDYTLRLATRSRQDGGQDLLKPDDAGGWVKYDDIPFGDVLTTSIAGLTDDGRTLYMIDSRGRDTAALYAIEDGGKPKLLLEHARADVGQALTHPTSGAVQAVAVEYLREEWQPLDPAIKADLQRLGAIGPGEFGVNARTLDDQTWIVAYSAAETPVVYYRYDRSGDGALTRLFSARPKLDGKPLVPMWPQEIKARDGLTLVSYLSLPLSADSDRDGRAERPAPLVLLVHGGPWARDGYGFFSYPQWLANRGYAVLSVNYRGSTGFGKNFVNKADGEWAGKMHDDLIDAVNWAVDQKITTADQVAIVGGSYGGYATLVGLTFTPETFKCGVDIVGPSNLNTLLSTIPPYWASFFEQFAKRIGDPRTEEGRKLLAERSPLTHVEKIQRPLLIGQGANDPRVKQPESDQIVAAMQAKNIPVTYVLFPDEGHGFARPENSMAFNAVNEAFLAQCLGGRAQPIGNDFTGSSISVPVGADGVPGLAEALQAHTQQIKQ